MTVFFSNLKVAISDNENYVNRMNKIIVEDIDTTFDISWLQPLITRISSCEKKCIAFTEINMAHIIISLKSAWD